jgi:hypothetical protein
MKAGFMKRQLKGHGFDCITDIQTKSQAVLDSVMTEFQQWGSDAGAGAGVHPELFIGGGGGLTLWLYVISLRLKIMLSRSCCKHNLTQSATAYMYIGT